MTFYRKYRPKTIDELDLTTVRERLSVIVKTKKFAHAYLFCGPRGTGKTSAARILAREAGADPVDVIEIDAASHRGIDDIRELRERVGIAPMVGEKKTYIIDEVHMLTAEAFNALLKTLEEPPSHVIFFLCTTAVEKVPDTVASRCVKIPFPQAAELEIVRALERTVTGEKLFIDNGVLELISSWADGSFREAQTILEETASNKDHEKIALSDVERVVGGSLTHGVTQFVTSVIRGDFQTAVNAVEDAVKNGGDLMVMARLILSSLRDRLVVDRTDRVLFVTKKIEECTRTLKYSLLPQLPLEIVALELGKESGVRSKGAGQHPEHSENSDDQNISIPESQSGQIITRPASPSIPSVPNTRISISISDLTEKWPQLLESVRKRNHGIVTLLAHCRPLSVEEGVVLVEAKYKFHKDQLMQERFRSLIEAEMNELVGGNIGVRFILGRETTSVLKTFASDDNIRAVADDELSLIAEEIFSTP